MRRRVSFAFAAAAAAAACFAAAGTAGTVPLHLTEAGGAVFPQRTYVLSLPAGQRLDRSQVKVNESGQRVVGLSIAPAGAATGVRSGVVLAIDASRSMRGAPTEGALAAGRAFAGRRNVNQRIALLTFNETSKVALSFTTSQTSIERALSRQPTLRFKTRLYDAVAQAIGLVRLAGIEAGSVIVLSDGADTDSTVTLDQVIDAAKKAHVRVFTVGLRSKTFHPQPLQQLASATGGSFSRADSPGALETIYDQLGLQLAQEYILTYNSIAKPGRRVALSVAVGGVGTTTAAYVSPTIAPPNAVFRRSSSDSFWQSPLTMVLVALLVAALLAFAVFVPFRRHASTVRTRISDYVSTRKADGDPLVSRVFTGTERSLEQTRRWQRLKDTLQFADIGIPPVQFVLGTSIVTLFVMWILSLAAGPLALFGLAVPLLVRSFILLRVRRKRRAFAEQLADNLDILASGMRAGHSLVGALSVVVTDAAEPSHSEFQRVVTDEQLGVPLDAALDKVAHRMRNRDLEQVAVAAAIQSNTGSNAAEVLDRVTDTIRERNEVRRLVKTLTAQGRLARWIVSALPVGLLCAITLVNGEYMKPLFSHTSGLVMLVISGVMIATGSYIIGRIVDIEV